MNLSNEPQQSPRSNQNSQHRQINPVQKNVKKIIMNEREVKLSRSVNERVCYETKNHGQERSLGGAAVSKMKQIKRENIWRKSKNLIHMKCIEK